MMMVELVRAIQAERLAEARREHLARVARDHRRSVRAEARAVSRDCPPTSDTVAALSRA